MKRNLLTFLLVVASFLLGWFVHGLAIAESDHGPQWRFVAAAQRGDLLEVQRLFPGREQIDDEPSYANDAVTGFPALLQAAGAGQFKVVAWLLAQGADPNRQTSDSWPLAAAEQHVAEATKTVELLKSHGAKNPSP